MRFLVDRQRHLVCVPYSIQNLHSMANQLGIRRCWFHRDHYDVPKTRVDEVQHECELVRPRDVLAVIRGILDEKTLDSCEGRNCEESLARVGNDGAREAGQVPLVGRRN